MDLEDKRILLSGATGGLGTAIAEQLAAAGARMILSSRKQKQLRELGRSLPGGLRRHKAIVADLAKVGAAEKLIADAGDLDCLVANAALPASGRLEGFTHTEISRALRVNLESPIQMARELTPKLIDKGEGHLLFVASIAGRYASARSSLYSATKFGLRGFALGLREDLAGTGVGISIVSPGLVRDAGMFADSGAKTPLALGATTPEKVAKSALKAIRNNRSEIVVAPFRQRRASGFAMRHPELAGRITRNERAQRVADSVAEGQTDKR